MGRMYAHRLRDGGIRTIYVCDKPETYDKLKEEYQISRLSDFIIYSVEAAAIGSVVALFGPSTKFGATVAGQTSVKAPEKEAFERYLPEDVSIVSVHSLHSPGVGTEGQPLIIIQHRAADDKVRMVEEVFKSFKSRYVYLSYDEHDLVTANTQAVTHAAFLSMGRAWHMSSSYPWETTRYVSGIEVVKVNITLRIYSAKWHVYAGLAILNPSAQIQIQQYARSTTELYKLMLEGKEEDLNDRVWKGREGVFGWKKGEEGGSSSTTSSEEVAIAEDERSASPSTARDRKGKQRQPILLSEDVLDQFSMGQKVTSAIGNGGNNAVGGGGRAAPNSHLSLLAMVDCWWKLGINPFEHLDVAGTPPFMLWIEYLFRSTTLLQSAINAGLNETIHRTDDLEFTVASRGWAECVSFGNFDLYERRFQETAKFFAPRFEDATKLGSKMIKAIQDAQAKR